MFKEYAVNVIYAHNSLHGCTVGHISDNKNKIFSDCYADVDVTFTSHYIKNVSADGLIIYLYAFDYFCVTEFENVNILKNLMANIIVLYWIIKVTIKH